MKDKEAQPLTGTSEEDVATESSGSDDTSPADAVRRDVEPGEMHLQRSGSHIVLGPLPLEADEASIELLQEIKYLSCSGRSLITVTNEEVSICFETLEDATEFYDTWDFLLRSMIGDSRAVMA